MKKLSPGMARPRPHPADYWAPPEAGGVLESAGGVVAGGVVDVPESEAGGVDEPVPESMAPPPAGGVVDSELPVSAGGVVVVPVSVDGVVVLEPVSEDGVVLEPELPFWPQAARPKVSAKAPTPRIALKRNFVCDVGLVI